MIVLLALLATVHAERHQLVDQLPAQLESPTSPHSLLEAQTLDASSFPTTDHAQSAVHARVTSPHVPPWQGGADKSEWTLDDVKANMKRAVHEFLANFGAYFFDCDGTLYYSGVPLQYVQQVINLLKQFGKKLFFVTNTSSKSAKALQEKLDSIGIAVAEHESVPSGVFTAEYIKTKYYSEGYDDPKPTWYVVGGQGVVDELENRDITALGGRADSDKAMVDNAELYITEGVKTLSEKFAGIAVGWDLEFNYYKLAKASLIFQTSPNALFYATNDDPADVLKYTLDGQHHAFRIPGNGPLLTAIEATCRAVAPERDNCVGSRSECEGKTCKAEVMGKPNPLYAEFIAEHRAQVDLAHTIMIGDRLSTDIMMGHNARQRGGNMGTLWVLTGVDKIDNSGQNSIREFEEMMNDRSAQPTYILPQLGAVWEVCSADPGFCVNAALEFCNENGSSEFCRQNGKGLVMPED